MIDSAFTLTKWYLDCVTADGEAAILYSARFGWKGVHLNCSSLLTVRPDGIASRFSMTGGKIDSTASEIRAEIPRLAVAGTWARRTPPFRTCVYEGEDGAVDWNCLQPGADVRILLGRQELNGRGYAECLTMTVPPWRLKLNQLRWGRFVSESHSLAWIDWRGAYSSSFAVLDGERHVLSQADESTVRAEGATLQFDESRAMRAGKLGETILPSAPRLRKLLPRSLAAIEERKWLSRATLDCGGQISHGWAIHEVVDWNL